MSIQECCKLTNFLSPYVVKVVELYVYIFKLIRLVGKMYVVHNWLFIKIPKINIGNNSSVIILES